MIEEKRREEVALALMLKDGHQPEDIGDWRKSVYAKKADDFIEQHSEDGLCLKCLDTGFTEQEVGLFRTFCDCEKGKALKAEITGEIPDEVTARYAPDQLRQAVETEVYARSRLQDREVTGESGIVPPLEKPEEVTHGSDSENGDDLRSPNGDDLSHPTTGSRDTGKPKQPRKPKAKGKAGKRRS